MEIGRPQKIHEIEPKREHLRESERVKDKPAKESVPEREPVLVPVKR